LLTASQGRSYEHTLCAGRSHELAAIARLCFGRGWLGRRFHALPQLALCLRDHGLAIEPDLPALASLEGACALEWCSAQGRGAMVALYHYKTRNYAMGTVAGYRPGFPGYQETVLHLRIGTRPEAQIWINHPGEAMPFGIGRPSYWAGSATLPRVHQYRALAIVDFFTPPERLAFTHAWLPVHEMDEVTMAADRVCVRSGGGIALLIGSSPFVAVEAGPSAGCEIRLLGRKTRWIVRLCDADDEESLERCAHRFSHLSATDASDGTISVEDPDYGPVTFRPTGEVVAEGRVLDPSRWDHAGILKDLSQAKNCFAAPR
jgi:hypothetical protein